ncbi:hypothetical protein HQ865_14485 [Mucilaginibacter mali]|uniref:Tetratricopeptide repeat protein n=1 Tax=Mucilaginibacter mali TaxID=2740462 RepID=A0A7D4Q200_9SPHI|nr:hypothetical protein [Mucilaginibacter mali]QKJ30906.1 hypothetical protein HQ865_14485 [Mucilaginibacter mali]
MKKALLIFIICFTASVQRIHAQMAAVSGSSVSAVTSSSYISGAITDTIKWDAFITKNKATLAKAQAAIAAAKQADSLDFVTMLATTANDLKNNIGVYGLFYPKVEIAKVEPQPEAVKINPYKHQDSLAFIHLLLANTDSMKSRIGLLSFVPTRSITAERVLIVSDNDKHPEVLASTDVSMAYYVRALEKADTANNPFKPVTDDELQASLGKRIAASFKDLAATDTLQPSMRPQTPAPIAQLKQQLVLVTNDTIRGSYYQKIADYYLLKYDSVTVRKTKLAYQEAAIEYTMKALHSYSKYSNNLGLRTCFNNLARVYKDQRKFSQAKWFILQSNTMSRQINDVPNIISSLVVLADIKMAIKDYSLAKGDLEEALTLSTQNKFPKQESIVQVSFSNLYTNLKDPKKATIALKRHDFIEDSLVKAEEAQRLAELKAQDSTRQVKKKLYTSAGKKDLKTNSLKKTVSL